MTKETRVPPLHSCQSPCATVLRHLHTGTAEMLPFCCGEVEQKFMVFSWVFRGKCRDEGLNGKRSKKTAEDTQCHSLPSVFGAKPQWSQTLPPTSSPFPTAGPSTAQGRFAFSSLGAIICLFVFPEGPSWGVCGHTGALKPSTPTQPAVMGKDRPGWAVSSAPSALGPTSLSHTQEEMLLFPGRVEAGLFLLYWKHWKRSRRFGWQPISTVKPSFSISLCRNLSRRPPQPCN